MNETEFRNFLKLKRRKASSIEQIIPFVGAFENYLEKFYPGKTIDQTTPESLESYVSWHESETGESASKPLWGLRYYFDFIENQELSDLAGELRSERVKRKPFFVRNFRGVNPEDIAKLELFNNEARVSHRGKLLLTITLATPGRIRTKRGWYCPQFGKKHECIVLECYVPQAFLPFVCTWKFLTHV